MTKKIPFVLALKALLCAIFFPSKFSEFEKKNTVPLGIPSATNNQSAFVISHAFWWSLFLVLVSALIGGAGGYALNLLCGVAGPALTYTLQAAGAAILLWGTLFVRGWEIQTYSCRTLIEKINQWIYRSLYCIGTAVFMSSLTWSINTSDKKDESQTQNISISEYHFLSAHNHQMLNHFATKNRT